MRTRAIPMPASRISEGKPPREALVGLVLEAGEVHLSANLTVTDALALAAQLTEAAAEATAMPVVEYWREFEARVRP